MKEKTNYNEYRGMNFQDWCALDEDDTRELKIKLYDSKEDKVKFFSSEQLITPNEMFILQESIIQDILLIDNHWRIKLVY